MISLEVQISLAPVKMTLVNGLLLGNLAPIATRLERFYHVVGVVSLTTGKLMALLLVLFCYVRIRCSCRLRLLAAICTSSCSSRQGRSHGIRFHFLAWKDGLVDHYFGIGWLLGCGILHFRRCLRFLPILKLLSLFGIDIILLAFFVLFHEKWSKINLN